MSLIIIQIFISLFLFIVFCFLLLLLIVFCFLLLIIIWNVEIFRYDSKGWISIIISIVTASY